MSLYNIFENDGYSFYGIVKIKLFLKLILIICVTLLSNCATKSSKSSEEFLNVPTVSPKFLSSGNCINNHEKYKGDDIEVLIFYSNQCIKENKWSQVEYLGQVQIERFPQKPWGAYYLSLVAEKKGEMNLAIWLIKLSLSHSPNLGVLRYQLGRLLWMTDQKKEAVLEITKALEVNPEISSGSLFLGVIYFHEQNYERASVFFQKTLKYDQKSHSALIGLAECEIQFGKIRSALNYFNQLIEYHPEDIASRMRKAQVIDELLRDEEEALRAYKEVDRSLSSGSLNKEDSELVKFKIAELEKSTLKKKNRIPATIKNLDKEKK